YGKILETLQINNISERQLEANEKNIIFINEPGLYSLILRSEKQEAKVFKRWVTSEVLPSIRQHGTYETPAAAALQIIQNPTGERKLHYKVNKYIEKTYPDVITSAGLGENQTTDFIRMDSYTKGQPGLELKCKLGSGIRDVVAIELKNHDRSNKTSPEQDAYV
ncbi:MAG: Bro-N domain-containing protein, partial [Candidatus Fonsibacter sp.]